VALPLQPGLLPWPHWLRRLLLLAGVASAVLALGLAAPARRAPPELLLTGPGHEYDYARRVERLIAGAHARIWVMMFVVRFEADGGPGPMAGALAAAAARGVRVQVCLDQGRDWQSGEPDLKHLAPAAWLSDHGVRVVLDELGRTSHTKALLVDRRWAVVGSHNWTRSALVSNREASLLVDDPGVAGGLEQEFAGIPGWDADY
jgi:phosphatidylserine/phosphatidylglycerophosphate/cardiolipin synthase-like enzyme